ncbi:Mor transcription activator family protein [Thiocystis violascens]|uniref:Mor transcription activator-like protein n=1 Tax=Thiocystis violascens (strain ATCC 17096 / DSM 198 / 6111) TaxID=765911 RepID=I3YBF0_THIV6|nr:Mor transcription activator family protein [Thiocystis violascens]AFL74318.1 Mor transcription activator-like protein [Thiocystis violascens DSM 198]
MVTINGVALPEARVRDHMPETLREVADLIGVAAALCLSKRFGGRSLYIPASPGPDSDITACIGWEAAQTLGRYFGQNDVVLPMARTIERLARDQALLQDRGRGATVRWLSFRYDLSERRVWEILAVHRAHEAPCGVVPIPESATARETTPRAAGRATSARAGNARAGFDGAR